jgi:hypothetical protein
MRQEKSGALCNFSPALLFSVFGKNAQEDFPVVRHDLDDLKANTVQVWFNIIHLAPF